MRARTIVLIVFALLLAGFVALNLGEFTRLAPLNFGIAVVALPFGLTMLLLLGAVTLGFLAWTLYLHRTNLLETRQYARELSAQRDLADKAEASRFTDLRQYLETQAAAAQHREMAGEKVMSERLAQQNRPVLERMEQLENTLAAYIGELEDRLEHSGGPAAGNHSGSTADGERSRGRTRIVTRHD
jgi:hypothetical protein